MWKQGGTVAIPVLFVAAFMSTWIGQSAAQAQAPEGSIGSAITSLEMSFVTNTVVGAVPFDVPLILTAAAPDTAHRIKMNFLDDDCHALRPDIQTVYGELMQQQNPEFEWRRADHPFTKESDKFAVPLIFPQDYLKPGRDYCILFAAYDTNHVHVGNTYVRLKPEPTLADHFRTDIGFAYAPEPRALVATLTTTFYFTAINEDVDLGERIGTARQLLQRFGLYIGLAPVVIDSDAPQNVESLLGIGSVVAGLSIRSPLYGPHLFGEIERAQRFLQPMRWNVGLMWYKQDHPNPLIAEARSRKALTVSVSYDIGIQSIVAPLAALFK